MRRVIHLQCSTCGVPWIDGHRCSSVVLPLTVEDFFGSDEKQEGESQTQWAIRMTKKAGAAEFEVALLDAYGLSHARL